MCIQLTIPAAPAQPQSDPRSAAKLLGPQQRQALAVDALAGTHCISRLAEDHDVSRQLVYQQVDKAEHALHEAFTSAASTDEPVRFYLPVTKRWLRRFIVALR